MTEIDVAGAGAKAATLARMSREGLAVPAFFVVGAQAYREHALRAGLSRDPDPAAARAALLVAPLDPGLLHDLAAAVAELGGDSFAVRSSAAGEDSSGLSWAGQFDTSLRVPAEDVPAAVMACWASLWGERPTAYRARNHVDAAGAEMSVIVQRFVDGRAGGVAFTADPVSGADEVVVESSPRGAQAIVSGAVAPERWAFTAAELGKTERDDPLADAARLGLAAAGLLASPADIEWVVDGASVWLLQARPITGTGHPRPAIASGDGAARHAAGVAAQALAGPYRPTAWSNVNTGEVLPEVVTPMTWSIVGKMATGLIDALFTRLGVRVDTSRLVTLVAGRAYFNASLLVSAFELMPMAGASDITSVFGGSEAPEGYPDLPPAPEDVAHASPLRVVLGLPVIAAWFLRHTARRARRTAERWRAGTDAASAVLATARDERGVWDVTRRLVGQLDGMTDAVAYMGVGMAYHGALLREVCRALGPEEGPIVLNTLLAGQGGIASAEAGLALARLGTMARREPQVRGALARCASWSGVRPRLEEEGPATRSFLDAWDAFMEEHGHHSRGELELAAPRWSESPDDVLAMVALLLDVTETTDLETIHAAGGRRAEAAEGDVLARLGPVRRIWFGWLLRQTRKGARTRENLKNEGVRTLAVTRRALLMLGGALAARGVLRRGDDILFLQWEELPDVLCGRLDPRLLAAERRARYEVDRTLAPPPVVIGSWDGSSEALATRVADELSGLGVASGVANGRARVIGSLLSRELVRPGEILVAPFTDPGWTPYFVAAAGIVVDLGGMLSHGSIIAREYGIPCVVNVGDATAVIRTGDLVEVDGDRGTVRILERAAAT